jgi:TPR repeat protein
MIKLRARFGEEGREDAVTVDPLGDREGRVGLKAGTPDPIDEYCRDAYVQRRLSLQADESTEGVVMLMRVLVAGAVAVMLAGAAAAGSLEDIEALWLSAAPRTDITLLRRAADQGDARSQYRLGMMYDLGLGVPLGYAEAANWLRKAASQGDDTAQAV